MTYAETQEYLFALRSLGSKFGLERMHALYEAAGKPADGLPIVHVAGTNGKGSVCAMVEAMARANGCKTGLFTSPHLLRLGERVQVNRESLTEQQIIDYVEELRPLCERIAAGDPQCHPTFFELMTVIALLHFERSGCDVVVLETGLGGRLDSTNVVRPAVCAITSIGLDHQEILGETLEQIAAEKAGIIKKGVPLVLGRLPESARQVILAQARQLGVSPLEAEAIFDPATLESSAACAGGGNAGVAGLAARTVQDDPAPAMAGGIMAGSLSHKAGAEAPALHRSEPRNTTAHTLRAYPCTSLAGAFQRRNAAVALLVCEQLAVRYPALQFDAETSLAALRTVQWAGRWQTLTLEDGCELILDSSHNEEGARALEENLSRFVAERGVRPVVITGALGKERARSLLAVIARHADSVFLVSVAQPRACSIEELRAAVPSGCVVPIHTASVEQLFAPQGRCGVVLAAYLRKLAALAPAANTQVAAQESDIANTVGRQPSPQTVAAVAATTAQTAAQTAAAGADSTSLTLPAAVPVLVTGSIYLIGEILSRLQGESASEGVTLQDKISR